MTIICPICKEEKNNLDGISGVKIWPNLESITPVFITICTECALKYGFEEVTRAR